jgi:hypothetical protein
MLHDIYPVRDRADGVQSARYESIGEFQSIGHGCIQTGAHRGAVLFGVDDVAQRKFTPLDLRELE